MGRFVSSFPIVSILVVQLIFLPVVARAEGESAGSYTLRKEEPTYKGGSIFVSSNKKNEVLMKANIWGAVQFPGVHYMPIGTRFLDAISFAGGPLDSAIIDSITLSSKPAAKMTDSSNVNLSVKDALISEKNNPVLQPDDIIFVKEDHTRDRIGLFLAIGTFVLTVAALGIAISNRK